MNMLQYISALIRRISEKKSQHHSGGNPTTRMMLPGQQHHSSIMNMHYPNDDNAITEVVQHPMSLFNIQNNDLISSMEIIRENGSTIFRPNWFDATLQLIHDEREIKQICRKCGMAVKVGEDTSINCPICHTGGYCFQHWRYTEDGIKVCIDCAERLYKQRNRWDDNFPRKNIQL